MGFWVIAYFAGKKYVSSNARVQTLLKIIILTTVIATAVGILQMFFGFSIIEANYRESLLGKSLYMLGYRAVGTLDSPFAYGLLVGIGLVLVISMSNISLTKSFKCLIFYATLFVLFIGVILSGSRGSYVGALVSLSFVGVMSARIRRRLLSGFLVLFLLGLLLFPIFASNESVVNKINLNYYYTRILSAFTPLEDINFTIRKDYLWRGLIPYAIANPFGYGTGSLPGSGHRFEPVLGTFILADNQYIRILIEQGIVALLIFMTMLVGFFLVFLRNYKRNRNLMALVSMGVLILFGITGIIGPSLEAYPANLIFWVLMGAAVSNLNFP